MGSCCAHYVAFSPCCSCPIIFSEPCPLLVSRSSPGGDKVSFESGRAWKHSSTASPPYFYEKFVRPVTPWRSCPPVFERPRRAGRTGCLPAHQSCDTPAIPSVNRNRARVFVAPGARAGEPGRDRPPRRRKPNRGMGKSVAECQIRTSRTIKDLQGKARGDFPRDRSRGRLLERPLKEGRVCMSDRGYSADPPFLFVQRHGRSAGSAGDVRCLRSVRGTRPAHGHSASQW